MRLLPRRLRHGEEATLVEHLGELRARIVWCLIALAAAFAVAYGFRAQIISWLNVPLPVDKRKPVTFSVAEPFLTSFWVSLWTGLLAALPVVLWNLWGFFAPAFQEKTQRMLIGFFAAAGGLVVGGVAFGYYVVLPKAISFLTSFDSELYNIQIRARDYYGFAVMVLVATAVAFELPVFILALVRIRVLTPRKLRRNRRIGYVIMAALAVALPGVDPVTTLLEMLPLVGLFEASIWISVFFEKRWKAKEEAEEAAFLAEGTSGVT